jgi:hypothetical protein
MAEERRGSFRCQMQPLDEAAVLRTKRSDLTVQIVEKSAGGFGVTSAEANGVKVGQILSLASSTGCCEVRVAHVTHDGETARIGLERLRESAVLNDRRPSPSQPARSNTFQFVFVCGACLAFFAGGVFVPSEWWQAVGVLSQPAVKVNPQERERRLAVDFMHLDNLTSRKFVEALQLDDQQQQRIGSIVQETTASLSKLYERRDKISSRQWSDIGLQLIQQSWNQIQAELTPEQQQRWRDLLTQTAQQPAAPSPSPVSSTPSLLPPAA